MSAKETENLDGEKILQLLESIDSESVVEKVQKLYQSAYEHKLSDPEKALEDCQKALEEIDPSSEAVFDNSMLFAYSRGKFYLLMASIHLNAVIETDWQKAEKIYLLSKEEFRTRGWSHLAGLASLGLAIARRKLGKFEEAINACSEAQKSLDQESIPSFINTNVLRKAIKEEYSEILAIKGRFPRYFRLPERAFPVFNILVGAGRIAGGEATGLNLLSREDYEQYVARPVEEVVINLTKYPSVRNADYILEIDAQAEVEDVLKLGDWLFIQAQSASDRLHGKTVAVLVDEGQGMRVGLRTCIKAEDHYFLKAQNKIATSIIIVNYKISSSRIRDFDTLYYEKKIIKRVDEVQVSGAVIDNGHIPQQTIQNVIEAYVWRMIPRISKIATGLGQPILEENIIEYVDLKEPEPKGDTAYFILTADGDSMTGDGISSGDYVLIRQQAEVEIGDIAAVVITTPDLEEPLGTLKRYSINESEGRQYWLLKSSNSTAQHLVVVPPDTDVAQIRRMYAKEIQTGKIRLYEKAELSVAGKYVKVVGKH